MKKLLMFLMAIFFASTTFSQTTNTFKYPIHANGGLSIGTQAVPKPLVMNGDTFNTLQSSLVYNVKDFGATGDGVTDDYTAIQSALDLAYANGGGIVFVPEGKYILDSALQVRDNITFIGEGYASNLHSTRIGLSSIYTGNIGDYSGGTGLWAEDTLQLNPITVGDTIISLATATDADSLIVGEIVLISGGAYWNPAIGSGFGSDLVHRNHNLNIVSSIEDTIIRLKYPIMDNMPLSAALPVMRRMRDVVGYLINGVRDTLWMSKNTRIANMRITQEYPDQSYYGIHACGVNNIYENLTMDGVASMFGSNALSHSVVRNIRGTYYMNASDFCDFQNNNVYENITGNMVSHETILPGALQVGFSVNRGCDNIINNINMNFGGIGWFNMDFCNRTTIMNSRIVGAGTNVDKTRGAINVGYGVDNQVTNNYINRANGAGILTWGDRTKITGNTIYNVGLLAANGAIIFSSTTYGANDIVVTDNIIGTSPRGTSDRIGKLNTFDKPTAAQGVFQNNIPYTENVYDFTGNAIVNVQKTIGIPGKASCDFNFASNANADAQPIDLGGIIPASCRVIAVEIICTETVREGATQRAVTMAAGNASAGTQYILAADCYATNHRVGIIDATKPAAVTASSAVTNVWIQGDVAGANWNVLTVGKWTVSVTYLKHTPRNP